MDESDWRHQSGVNCLVDVRRLSSLDAASHYKPILGYPVKPTHLWVRKGTAG
jgi:hypothetical protein